MFFLLALVVVSYGYLVHSSTRNDSELYENRCVWIYENRVDSRRGNGGFCNLLIIS